MKVLVILFFTAASFAQQPVSITIDSIITAPVENAREFTIAFSIANTADESISFMLNPEALIPAHDGSLQLAVFYGIFDSDERMNAAILNTDYGRSGWGPPSDGTDTTKVRAARSYEEWRADVQQYMLTNTITLEPKEKRSYTKKMYWDFGRYKKYDDNEYYIDPGKPHFLQLSLVLLKEEYETIFTEEQNEMLNTKPGFIKGGFVSNKIEIDFSE